MLLWDGFGLQSTHSGIGRHALELVEGLARLNAEPLILPSVPRLDPAFRRWQAAIPAFAWGRIKVLSLLAARNQANLLVQAKPGPHIFHGLSNYNIPKLPRDFQKVLTTHDLIPFLTKDGVSQTLRRYLKFQFPRALDEADRIVCVSNWTAQTLMELFPATKDKIQVILNGRPALLERRQGGANRNLRLFSLCRHESYKRLSMIPEILKHLPESFEWHVLTDAKGVALLKDHRRLILHQSLSDAAVKDLWNRTEIFVHPSLWEGYCLPAASALSFCIPTLFTGGSGIDEVVGNAGQRMERSAGPALWAAAIEELSQSPNIWQERCREQWLSLPSWLEVARQFQSLYATLGYECTPSVH